MDGFDPGEGWEFEAGIRDTATAERQKIKDRAETLNTRADFCRLDPA
jgi:hypothetical protein